MKAFDSDLGTGKTLRVEVAYSKGTGVRCIFSHIEITDTGFTYLPMDPENFSLRMADMTRLSRKKIELHSDFIVSKKEEIVELWKKLDKDGLSKVIAN